MLKKTIFIVLLSFLIIQTISAALPPPSEEEYETALLIVTGEVIDTQYLKTIGGTKYYQAEIKLETIRLGNNIAEENKTKAQELLNQAKEQGFVTVYYEQYIPNIIGSLDAFYIKGEKVTAYLTIDPETKQIQTFHRNYGKKIIEPAPFYIKIFHNNITYIIIFSLLITLISFLLSFKKIKKTKKLIIMLIVIFVIFFFFLFLLQGVINYKTLFI